VTQFLDWVLSIGNTIIGEINDENTTINIPSDMLIDNSRNSLADIVNKTYPSFFTIELF